MEYTFKTKQMIKVSEKVGNYFDLQKASFDCNITKLSDLISIFGDITQNEAMEYIDEQIEKGKTINNLYEEIFKGINEKGFFKEQLDVNLKTLPIDMNKLTEEMYEKFMNKEIEKQLSKTSKNM